jgi:hypothetical protein
VAGVTEFSKWQPFQSIPLRILHLRSLRDFRLFLLARSGCVQSASIISLRGAVAQLGERLICIQEVAGSIPTSSTSLLGLGSVSQLAEDSRSGPVAQVVRAHP